MRQSNTRTDKRSPQIFACEEKAIIKAHFLEGTVTEVEDGKSIRLMK